MRKIFSGIQPSGCPHIGNFIGALKEWVCLQDSPHNAFPPIYCIVDLHAITTRIGDPMTIHSLSLQTAASLLACGLNPNKSILYLQSTITQHTQLSWVLSCLAQTGELGTMTQWKSRKVSHRSSLGLFSYPVLMAADILLYNATHVPVGNDQMQHIELTKELARHFNYLFSKEYFVKPEAIMPDMEFSRIMNLRAPLEKMSKSHSDEMSRINLIDSPSAIKSKIMKSVTDSAGPVTFNTENRPGVSNLLTIFATFNECSIKEASMRFEGKNSHQLKIELYELLIEKLSKIRNEYLKICDDRLYLESILKKGEEEARIIADKTMKEVFEIVGITNG